MGGDYFKLGRVPRERYMEIETKLRAFLDECFGRDSYRIPRYYGAKSDFGDVDVGVTASGAAGSDSHGGLS